jgi:hypothetical protein
MLKVENARPGQYLNMTLSVANVSQNVVVSAESIANLPVNGRNVSQYAMLQPGAANNFSNYSGGAETTVSEALVSENAGVKTAASGEEIGDLFEYRIEQPVSVNRDRSALIPIIQTKMEGERVAIYNEGVRQDRPYSGVLLKNATALTLESGSITVLDGDAYAGEALMERLKPKEQRLISFALDLGTNVRVRGSGDREPARLVKIVDGTFQVHYFRSEQRTYEITNQTDKQKTVYIEYPVREGWQLSDKSPKPDYVTQRYYRFRVELKPFEETSTTVGVKQPLMDTYQLGSLTRNDVQLFVSMRYIDDATRARLEKLIDIRTQIGTTEGRLESFDDEVGKIAEDQKRLRDNIETLAKTPDAKALVARYIAKAGEQETRLEEMEKQRKQLEADKERLRQELATEIRAFELK